MPFPPARITVKRRRDEDPVDALSRTPHQLRREPRKFHFTRTTTSIRNPSVLHSGIQKTRKKQNHNLATFVERTDSFEKSRYHGRNPPNLGEKRPELGSDPLRPSVDLLGSRKRPLASTAERKWREQTWKQPPQSNAREEPAVERTEGRDAGTDSLHLASQLQQFALDVSRAEDEAHGAHAKTHAKVKPKPKPPKPRPSKAETEATEGTQYDHGDAMDLSEIQGDNPENFVFDVYVRQTEHLHEEPLTGMQNTALNSADPDKVGVLVIADEDQETWELYGAEDQSSDEDWNSEEENENAEGYYGNDYPEDELDSDDEHDRDTYRHWQSAFDDEEFEENINWSDDEAQEKRSWNIH
ncbi:MAG: hypothetical protein LQ338_000249 [Usnochroma carphineum]|nr:MAG: hypothetical protein LQ338_000249 [Usnochroma carphineum]